MTREETKNIIRVLMVAYPNFKPENLTETIGVWQMMLDDADYKLISMAVKSYIRANSSGFAPSIGELMEYANRLTTPEEMTETKAWGLVMNAIRNSGYNSEEEFNKLPERIQKAVGSPKQLWSMATDESFNEQVASSNFMRAYRTVVNRENEIKKLSPDVMKMIENINNTRICVNEK